MSIILSILKQCYFIPAKIVALSFQHVFLKALLGRAYLGCTSQKILTIIHALLIQKQGGVLWFLYKESSFVFIFSE